MKRIDNQKVTIKRKTKKRDKKPVEHKKKENTCFYSKLNIYIYIKYKIKDTFLLLHTNIP